MRALLVAAVVLFVLFGGLVWYARVQLTGSFPMLDGELPVPGLLAPVTVTRDGLGVPTIEAQDRLDAARALGVLHAQERFFQMDLQRRQAAGELSALVGARALPADRTMRLHRFRSIARQALSDKPALRDLLDAYTEGVNLGLSAMTQPPFEYLLLGQTPAPWTPEDSMLTILAMFNTLQGRQAAFEGTLATIDEVLPPSLAAFLTARGSEWDAPVVGQIAQRPPIPGSEIFDLRSWKPKVAARHAETPLRISRSLEGLDPDEAAGIGSNNWAVSGAHTASGAALVANDMHLAINVPNIWYRALIRVGSRQGSAEEVLQLAGFTLPGLPGMVVGSNGHVAWGFTNSGGDWSDLVVVEIDSTLADHYITPHGPRRFDDYDETIEVADGPPESVRVRWTTWGPLIGTDARGRPLAQKWVAHDASVLGRDIAAPEEARSAAEALRRFAGMGIPGQNVVVGDREGHIAWTIAGTIPRRRGFDGSRPLSWADGSRGWDGYLPDAAFPRIVDPPSGRIWTANAPVVDGSMLETIGEGGYADGIRARMIRDRLMTLDRATPRDLLAVQLDDGALFHERWRALIVGVLRDTVMLADPQRAEFKRLVESTWTGRASPDSVAYRLVRSVRQRLNREVLGAITAPAREVDADFDFTRAQRSEGPLWQLVTERPLHLLDPKHATWDEQILSAIDATIAEAVEGSHALADSTWGAFNRALVTHPLAAALPLVGGWLNMPSDALAGDVFTPRAHAPRTGPSERLVVSPGQEAEGVAHMPAGQSGHPLSPHYRDQHRAWVDGTPLPFMPGPAQHTLKLVTAAASRPPSPPPAHR